MATEFVMPKLGLTMEEGTITEWLVEDGKTVAVGDAVLVIETDKVETEVESPDAGILHRIGTVAESFGCGEVIAYLLADGEEPPVPTAAPAVAPAATEAPAASTPTQAAAATAPAGGRLFATPNARRVAADLGVTLRSVRGTGPGGRIVSEDVEHAHANPPAPAATPGVWAPVSGGSSTPATAAARQLAELLGIDIRIVPASSRDGRRSREDVAAHVRQQLAAKAERDDAPSPPLLQTPTSVVPMTGMRGAIASRMHDSLREMAQLTLHLDASMDAVIADRETRKKAGRAPGYTDYVIAAVARALREHPIVNAQVTDDGIALLPDVNVGMAVAVDDGLLVPVVRNADRLDLSALSTETARLAGAARDKKVALTDLEGGTFSVSTLGMFGVDGFTPVINAPNVAILGVGRLRKDLKLVDWGVDTTSNITLSLTWDHRVLDGAPAAEFTRRIADLLADPKALDS